MDKNSDLYTWRGQSLPFHCFLPFCLKVTSVTLCILKCIKNTYFNRCNLGKELTQKIPAIDVMTEQHFSYNGHCTRIFFWVQNIFTTVVSQNRSPLCCSKLLAWFGLPSFKLACRVTTRKTKVTGCDQLLQVLVEILLLSTVEFLLLSTTDDTTKHFVSLCSKITQFFKVLCIAYKICCFKDVVLNTRTNPYFSKLISTSTGC